MRRDQLRFTAAFATVACAAMLTCCVGGGDEDMGGDTPPPPADNTVNITGVTITPETNLTVPRSHNVQLRAAVLPMHADQSVEWSIEPETAGYIDDTGLLTADTTIDAGTTITVTATSVADATKKATKDIIVTAGVKPVTSVTITQTGTLLVPEGGYMEFRVTVQPVTADYQEIMWTVTPTEMASIGYNGVLRLSSAATVGSTLTVTATALDNTTISDSREVTVVAPTPRNIATSNDGHGTTAVIVDEAPATSAIPGKTVTVTATPYAGYAFKRWVCSPSDLYIWPDGVTANPAMFTMPNREVSLKAEFTIATYGISVYNDLNGTGTATVDGTTATSAAEGQTVTLRATPAAGYVFKQWSVVSGGASLSDTKTNPATFIMPANAVAVRAEFMIPTYAITITDNGKGTGRATVNGRTVISAAEGETVTLTATPAGISNSFYEWTVVVGYGYITLSPDNKTNPVTFTMPARAVTVRVDFYLTTHIDFIGSWGPATDFTITDDKLVYNSGYANYTIENLTWTRAYNTAGYHATDYPSGFKFTGTLTNLIGGLSLPKADGTGSASVGDQVSIWFYIHTDRGSLVRGLETYPYQGFGNPIVKRQ